MTIEQLKAKLAALQEKQAAAFDKMIESATDENIKSYEESIKVTNLIENQINEMERKALEKKPAPDVVVEGADGGKKTFDEEAKAFVKKLAEAVAVGSTYTGLVPLTLATEILKKREAYGKLRPLCRKISLSGDYQVTIDGDQVTAEYVAESGEVAEKTPTVTTVKFSAYKLGAMVKVSKEFLNDVALDAMSWLVENLARAFAKKEDTEIINGTGSANSHVTGILTSVTANAVTAASATAITLDEIQDLLTALGDYADGAVLLMNAATKGFIKKLKDENGQYYHPISQELKEVGNHKIVTVSDIDTMAARKRAVTAPNLD